MVRLKDIAVKAGVSVSTVSQALRDHHSIGEETKERIRQIQKELGYTRHLRVRKATPAALAAPHQGMMQVVFLLIDRTFADGQYAVLYEAMVQASDSSRCRYFYLSLKSEEVRKGQLPDILLKGDLQGVVVSGIYDEASHRTLLKLGIPVLVMGNYDLGPLPRFSCEMDYEVGMHLIAQNLMRFRHQKVMLLLPFPHFRYEQQVSYLLQTCAARYGVEIEVLEEADPMLREKRLREHLSRPDRVTAIVMASGSAAETLYRICNELGLSIPGDISLVSVSNSMQTQSHSLQPPLASLAFEVEALGESLVRCLFQIVSAPASLPRRELIGGLTFAEGGSIGPAPTKR